jgi:hypothetical protein
VAWTRDATTKLPSPGDDDDDTQMEWLNIFRMHSMYVQVPSKSFISRR